MHYREFIQSHNLSRPTHYHNIDSLFDFVVRVATRMAIIEGVGTADWAGIYARAKEVERLRSEMAEVQQALSAAEHDKEKLFIEKDQLITARDQLVIARDQLSTEKVQLMTENVQLKSRVEQLERLYDCTKQEVGSWMMENAKLVEAMQMAEAEKRMMLAESGDVWAVFDDMTRREHGLKPRKGDAVKHVKRSLVGVGPM